MRHFLEVDDLSADELADVLDRSRGGRPRPRRSPARAWRSTSRSRRCAPVTRARWPSCSSAATRSRSGATRSAPAPASRSPTSPACSPATTRCSARGSSRTTTSSASRRPTRCRSSTSCRTTRIRARRSPTCSRCARSWGASPAAPWPTSATSTTWPARWPSARPCQRHGRAARLPAGLRADATPTSTGSPASAARRLSSPAPTKRRKGADAVHTDVWTSMGFEAEAADRDTAFEGFQVDDEVMAAAQADAVFMHCLPAHRGEEVSAAGGRRPAEPHLPPGPQPHARACAGLLLVARRGQRTVRRGPRAASRNASTASRSSSPSTP